MFKLMRKCKNRYFYHIFVSPARTPLWQWRSMLYGWKYVYKLSRSMYPSNYNRLWDISETDKTRRAVSPIAKLIDSCGKTMNCNNCKWEASSVHKPAHTVADCCSDRWIYKGVIIHRLPWMQLMADVYVRQI